jgi:hypothetical protein
MPAVSTQSSSNIAASVSVRMMASSCVFGGVAPRPRRGSRRGLATDPAWKLCAAFCLVFIVISLYAEWRQRLIRNDSVTTADETFGQTERELQRQPLCWPGKISARATNPIAGRADSSREMKKSILYLGAFIGVGLAAVSCQNPNEVSYETGTSAAATGSGGNQVKAKPSAFGPENTPGR